MGWLGRLSAALVALWGSQLVGAAADDVQAFAGDIAYGVASAAEDKGITAGEHLAAAQATWNVAHGDAVKAVSDVVKTMEGARRSTQEEMKMNADRCAQELRDLAVDLATAETENGMNRESLDGDEEKLASGETKELKLQKSLSDAKAKLGDNQQELERLDRAYASSTKTYNKSVNVVAKNLSQLRKLLGEIPKWFSNSKHAFLQTSSGAGAGDRVLSEARTKMQMMVSVLQELQTASKVELGAEEELLENNIKFVKESLATAEAGRGKHADKSIVEGLSLLQTKMELLQKGAASDARAEVENAQDTLMELVDNLITTSTQKKTTLENDYELESNKYSMLKDKYTDAIKRAEDAIARDSTSQVENAKHIASARARVDQLRAQIEANDKFIKRTAKAENSVSAKCRKEKQCNEASLADMDTALGTLQKSGYAFVQLEQRQSTSKAVATQKVVHVDDVKDVLKRVGQRRSQADVANLLRDAGGHIHSYQLLQVAASLESGASTTNVKKVITLLESLQTKLVAEIRADTTQEQKCSAAEEKYNEKLSKLKKTLDQLQAQNRLLEAQVAEGDAATAANKSKKTTTLAKVATLGAKLKDLLEAKEKAKTEAATLQSNLQSVMQILASDESEEVEAEEEATASAASTCMASNHKSSVTAMIQEIIDAHFSAYMAKIAVMAEVQKELGEGVAINQALVKTLEEFVNKGLKEHDLLERNLGELAADVDSVKSNLNAVDQAHKLQAAGCQSVKSVSQIIAEKKTALHKIDLAIAAISAEQ